MMKATALLFLALTGAALARKQVLRTGTLTGAQSDALHHLESISMQFDFWKSPREGGSADIMADERDIPVLEAILAANRIHYSLHLDNVEDFLLSVSPKNAAKLPADGLSPRITFTEYHTHDEINAYIDGLAADAAYSSFVSTVSVGTTYEGNDMRAIQINKAAAGAPNVFIEAGIHAREWIAPAVATYLIYELVENNAANANFVDNLNVYVIPVANPDGYKFSWGHDQPGGEPDDRLWRKNREPNPGSVCIGTDLNRNWPFQWDVSGTSDSPCGATYPGETPGDTGETVMMTSYFNSMSAQPELCVALHAAAELFLTPYGYALNSFPSNIDEITTLGQAGVDALNALNGETFEVLGSARLYPAAGASDDWYANEGVRYVYTPELREGDVSVFVLPENEILPSGQEMFEAFKVFFQQVIDDAGGQ